MKQTRPYGLWQGSMPLSELFSQPSAPMYPFRWRGRLFWLQARPEDAGRVVLMSLCGEGETRCLTPAGFDIRTRTHEYGGCCFCVAGDAIVFNNFSDGRLYLQALDDDSPPMAVTAIAKGSTTARSFADLCYVPAINMVVAIMESSDESTAPVDRIVAVTLEQDCSGDAGLEPVVLVEGVDFYASPVCTPAGDHMAWIEWDNPYMPWDQSRLCQAQLRHDGDIRVTANMQVVAGTPGQAVCQPGYLEDGRLVYIADSDKVDFWDFFVYSNGQIRRITSDDYEYGEAHWVFGQCRWQQVGKENILCNASDHGGDRLMRVDIANGQGTILGDSLAALSHFHCDRHHESGSRELLYIAAHADREAEIRSCHGDTGEVEVLYPLRQDDQGSRYVAPVPISYSTRDGETAYAYYYAPSNRNFQAPSGTRPPLLVMVHGGPTSRSTAALNLLKQYFVTLGFALLDVNHRGSTGHGRRYRQALLGAWGQIDAADIVDGVSSLIREGRVDADQVFIRGGSAGGYAVLRVLTEYPEQFRAGACYYGIGNLETLAAITHKFEGCYTDRLVGETYSASTAKQLHSRFFTRSPINYLDRLSSSLVLFQGLEDKVVPPALSREVADLLRQKGIQYEYVEYPGEGHGFRRLETRVDALQRETAFFTAIIAAQTDEKFS